MLVLDIFGMYLNVSVPNELHRSSKYKIYKILEMQLATGPLLWSISGGGGGERRQTGVRQIGFPLEKFKPQVYEDTLLPADTDYALYRQWGLFVSPYVLFTLKGWETTIYPVEGDVWKSYCESNNYRESRVFCNTIISFKVQPRLLKYLNNTGL